MLLLLFTVTQSYWKATKKFLMEDVNMETLATDVGRHFVSCYRSFTSVLQDAEWSPCFAACALGVVILVICKPSRFDLRYGDLSK